MVLTICRQNWAKFWASVLLATLHGYQVPLNSHPRRKMALAAPSLHQGLGQDGEVLVVGTGRALGQGSSRAAGEDGDTEHEAVAAVAPLVEHPVLGSSRAVHAVPAAGAQEVVRGDHRMGPGDRGEVGQRPGSPEPA